MKDLLIHEAHRHPWIERLSQMYLMRFRHKKRFASSAAGAVWRHIFVQTLMPWMRKYRVLSQARLKQSMEALAINRMIKKEEAKGLARRFEEDMQRIKENLGSAGCVAGAGVMGVTRGAMEAAESIAGGTVEISEMSAWKTLNTITDDVRGIMGDEVGKRSI